MCGDMLSKAITEPRSPTETILNPALKNSHHQNNESNNALQGLTPEFPPQIISHES